MRVLNLYSGVGGNRKLWDAEVTAVEYNPKIAEVYRKLYPDDKVIVGDAHQYLLDHYDEFDFIWSSPPCPTHSRMAKATRHKHLKRYPDFRLYEEIVFLTHFCKVPWVVENVVPYYQPLIEGKKIGRHIYWSNFDVGSYQEPMPKDFINLANLAGKKKLQDWLGIHFEQNIYIGNNHCPAQVLRNCVHPNEGLSIFEKAKEIINGRVH